MAGSKDRSGARARGGQILVVFAGGVVMLFVIAGLVIDGGMAFLNRRDGQNSADVAAMAGTEQLADYYRELAPLNVYRAISESMTANGCEATCTWSARYVGPRQGAEFKLLRVVSPGDSAPPGGALGVKVEVTRKPSTFFLGAIGQTSWTVHTSATAVSGDPTGASASQLLPIGIWQLPEYETGTIYAFTNGKDAPGNFSWLSWFGGTSTALSGSICSPDNPAFALKAKPTFTGDPGKDASASVRDCLQQLVDHQKPVLIPIVKPVPGSGGERYEVVAIASFTITSFSTPAVDQINGRFEGTVPYSLGATAPGGITQHPNAQSPFYYIGLSQ